MRKLRYIERFIYYFSPIIFVNFDVVNKTQKTIINYYYVTVSFTP